MENFGYRSILGSIVVTYSYLVASLSTMIPTVNHDMIHAASRSVEPCWACVIIVDILAGAFVRVKQMPQTVQTI